MIITAADFFSRSPAELPPEVEDAFFSAIRNRNSTFKRTYRARFSEIDRDLVQFVKAEGLCVRELLDVAISSGTTTLDLQAAFAQAGMTPRITGTDLALGAALVPLGWGCSALVSPDGHPLQYSVGKVALRPWRRRLDWLTGMWLARPVLLRWLARRLRRARSRRPVLLVSPRLSATGDVCVVEDDVLVARPQFVGRFDLIRAANILNRDYFDAQALKVGLANLQSYLSGPGALLLLLRTLENGTHHGTLFRLAQQGRLAVVRRFGDGSEVEDLTLRG